MTPRGLATRDAARYLGVSVALFYRFVLPTFHEDLHPAYFGTAKRWDVRELDVVFDKLKARGLQVDARLAANKGGA